MEAVNQQIGAAATPQGDIVVFRCWTCATEIVRMQGEYGQLMGWVTCPQCQNGQGIMYSFPTAKAEVE